MLRGRADRLLFACFKVVRLKVLWSVVLWSVVRGPVVRGPVVRCPLSVAEPHLASWRLIRSKNAAHCAISGNDSSQLWEYSRPHIVGWRPSR